MLKVAYVSSNRGKSAELVRLAQNKSGIEIIPISNLIQDDLGHIEESGSTYLENARIKAKHGLKFVSYPCLGDDSGVEILALDGAPGLYSARWAGEGCKPIDNINKTLSLLRNAKDRSARFRCVLCLLFPDGREISAEGILLGKIAEEPKGEGGFGYDPIFIPRGYDKTLAELKEDGEVITHRSLAFDNLFTKLIEDKWISNGKHD